MVGFVILERWILMDRYLGLVWVLSVDVRKKYTGRRGHCSSSSAIMGRDKANKKTVRQLISSEFSEF